MIKVQRGFLSYVRGFSGPRKAVSAVALAAIVIASLSLNNVGVSLSRDWNILILIGGSATIVMTLLRKSSRSYDPVQKTSDHAVASPTEWALPEPVPRNQNLTPDQFNTCMTCSNIPLKYEDLKPAPSLSLKTLTEDLPDKHYVIVYHKDRFDVISKDTSQSRPGIGKYLSSYEVLDIIEDLETLPQAGYTFARGYRIG